jgi:excisionase family DNA binding protein
MDTNVTQFVPGPRIPDYHAPPDPGLTLDRDGLPLLLPVPRAARLLGISRSAAYRLAETGELPVRRLGGRIYVVTARLLDLVGAQ